MSKDKTDTATIDLLNPNRHGGYRSGAGRKKGVVEKVKVGWSVTREAKEKIEDLSKGKPYSPAEYLNHLMVNAKNPPDSLE